MLTIHYVINEFAVLNYVINLDNWYESGTIGNAKRRSNVWRSNIW